MILRGLIAAAVTVAVVIYFVVRFHEPITPVCQPVRIAKGYHLTKEFEVGRESEYAVRLHCKRIAESDQLYQIIHDKLDVTCTVFENGVVISHNRVHTRHPVSGFKGPYGAYAITRCLDRFSASPSKSYRIEFTANASHPELDPTEPTLLVELDASVASGIYQESIPFVLVGIVSGPVALFYLIAACILKLPNTDTELRRMNRKPLTILWAISWILLVLGFAVAAMEGIESYGDQMIMGKVSTILSWVWFGILWLSPILTCMRWKKLGVKIRIFGLLYPGFCLLAVCVIGSALDFFFGNRSGPLGPVMFA